jgi:methionyl-tRNA formyltransferase
MNFGKIDQWILFGGGQLLAGLSLKLKELRLHIFVVTSDRHASEFISLSEKITLRDFLIGNDMDFLVSDDVNNDSDVISRITKNTLGVSMGAAWIFKADFINIFEGKLLNIHGTKLPQDRGAGGFSWRILRNERLGISLIHQVDQGVDTGDIIKYDEYFYPHSCRLPIDYENYYVFKNLELLDKFIDDIKKCAEFEAIKQQEYFSTYWPRLDTDKHGFVDWNWRVKDIEQFICAFDDPYKGASTFLNGLKVRLKGCFSVINDGTFHPFQKGFVYKISGSSIFVAAGDGSLIIQSVKDDNDNDIFNNVKIGDRFYTPVKYLEDARQFRAVYSPVGLKK